MDLRSHYPYALLRHGIVNSYPSLKEDIKADIVIMGAGISGSLIADELVRNGFDVVIVDKRHAGMGSTAASTSLLQYEIDIPLFRLVNLVGKKHAVESYRLCREAIYLLQEKCSSLKVDSLFSLRPSFQFASAENHFPDLKTEYTTRKKYGFNVELLSRSQTRNCFTIDSAGGIYSEDGAEADAYRITHELLSHGIQKGLRVYDHTEISEITYQKKKVKLLTAAGNSIIARKIIIACGYESQKYIPRKVQSLHSTYAITSEPQMRKTFWYKNSLIWETARPYLYLRTTSDNRIIIGGKDIASSHPGKRDALLKTKKRSLENSFHKLFPEIPFTTDFSWAGVFASTKDGLPFIGSIPERPNTLFALGYGGNGTTFSVIAAIIIRDLLFGKTNPAATIFSFNR